MLYFCDKLLQKAYRQYKVMGNKKGGISHLFFIVVV